VSPRRGRLLNCGEKGTVRTNLGKNPQSYQIGEGAPYGITKTRTKEKAPGPPAIREDNGKVARSSNSKLDSRSINPKVPNPKSSIRARSSKVLENVGGEPN